jgi:AcrR family transcriptional regulator
LSISPTPDMTRRGRRAGDPDTRMQILDAARSAFARVGYDAATIRLIAADAKVDPALVHHYFGNKEDLFAEAVHVPFRPADALQGVFGEGIEGAGEQIARLFFTIWEAEPSREAVLGQLRRAMVTPEAPMPFAEFITSALLRRAVGHLRGKDRELRLELMASHLVGLAMVRYVLKIEPLASAPIEQLIAQVAPRVQTYLNGSVE